ncbi:MAG: NIPSNAP family protein [Ginsengibacter sp.]
MKRLKNIITIIICIGCLTNSANAQKIQKEYYQFKLFHTKTNEQLTKVDDYLEKAYVPALHRQDIKNVGVFKSAGIDTLEDKIVYVFITYPSLEQWQKTESKLLEDDDFANTGMLFTQASADKVPFERIESILLEAFTDQPKLVAPGLKNPERVFELRSYESPTLDLHQRKIKMFNEGGEINIFKRLDFKVVFYAKVISGPRMPNFMYMPAFSSIDEYKPHWKAFGDDPAWKTVQEVPEFQNKASVSRIESTILKPTAYSDL